MASIFISTTKNDCCPGRLDHGYPYLNVSLREIVLPSTGGMRVTLQPQFGGADTLTDPVLWHG